MSIAGWIGLGVSLIAICTPLVKLIISITRLDTTMQTLSTSVEALTERNDEEHEKIWSHEGKQDARINDHEVRIQLIEHK